MDLDGRTAVVTGAGAGIGRETAKRLAGEGARVVVADVDAGGGEETAAMIGDAGGSASFRELDVTDGEAVEEAIREVDDAAGLDVLVNNAGVGQLPELLEETRRETRDRILSVNVVGVWNGCRAAIPRMKERGEGVVVNTSSLAGTVGAPRMATYALSKAAVLNFTRAVAAEAGSEGVRVNAVCPGFVDTEMVGEYFAAHDDPEGARERTEAMYPLGRIADPEEVAACIAFLASGEASFVTGHGLVVDGGYSAY